MSTVPASAGSPAGDEAGEFPRSGPADVGLYFFLVALGMAFAAAMIAYVVVRTGHVFRVTSAEGLEAIGVPVWFWFSTFFILLASVVLHYAKASSGLARPRRTRRALWAAVASSWVFLGLQVPGMVELVRAHRALVENDVRVYALLLLLVVIHALHVTGGLAPLTYAGATARRRPMGIARFPLLRRITIYWHFLAVVWIVMFNGMLLLG